MTWLCEGCGEFQQHKPADIHPDVCHTCLDAELQDEAELQQLEREENDEG